MTFNRLLQLSQKCYQNPVRSIFKLDEQLEIIREVVYNKEGEKQKVISSDYKYDNKGNWIYKLQYIGDHPEEVIMRKITYFDNTN